jgi:hypothetical protein
MADDERVIIICMTTTTVPIPGCPSELRWCGICAQQVWQSWDTMSLEGEIVCSDCAPGVLAIDKDGGTLKMSRKVRERFRAEGMSDAEIDRIARFAERQLRGKP